MACDKFEDCSSACCWLCFTNGGFQPSEWFERWRRASYSGAEGTYHMFLSQPVDTSPFRVVFFVSLKAKAKAKAKPKLKGGPNNKRVGSKDGVGNQEEEPGSEEPAPSRSARSSGEKTKKGSGKGGKKKKASVAKAKDATTKTKTPKKVEDTKDDEDDTSVSESGAPVTKRPSAKPDPDETSVSESDLPVKKRPSALRNGGQLKRPASRFDAFRSPSGHGFAWIFSFWFLFQRQKKRSMQGERISNPYMYKNGKWAIKVDGHEKFSVPWPEPSHNYNTKGKYPPQEFSSFIHRPSIV